MDDEGAAGAAGAGAAEARADPRPAWARVNYEAVARLTRELRARGEEAVRQASRAEAERRCVGGGHQQAEAVRRTREREAKRLRVEELEAMRGGASSEELRQLRARGKRETEAAVRRALARLEDRARERFDFDDDETLTAEQKARLRLSVVEADNRAMGEGLRRLHQEQRREYEQLYGWGSFYRTFVQEPVYFAPGRLPAAPRPGAPGAV